MHWSNIFSLDTEKLLSQSTDSIEGLAFPKQKIFGNLTAQLLHCVVLLIFLSGNMRSGMLWH